MNSRSNDEWQGSIAQAAERTGLTIDTLRYYERAGLLPRVPRDSGGRRRYGHQDIGWISLICCLRDTGMPLPSIKAFSELTMQGETTVEARLSILTTHDQQISAAITNLEQHRQYLQTKIDAYRARLDS